MAEREVAEPGERRIRYRIGINIGDIVLEEGDIFGDGVNVAARLEGLAEPGGICVARNVYNQVKGKLDLGFQPMGEHKVKNIAEPVTVYRVVPGPGTTQARPAAIAWALRRHRPTTIAAAVAVLLAASAAGAWYAFWRPSAPPAAVAEIAGSGAAQAIPALPLPDKPSIAVLPFSNLSGDAEQGHFADALTEDIITGLARFRDLFVISSNSSFRYKGQAADIKQVGRELGVRFILEGSARRAKDRLRVTTQLIDATTDEHLWAETYDRELTTDSYFGMQDEITKRVIAALGGFHGKLYEKIADSAQRKHTDSLQAYELYVLATHLKQTEYTEAAHRKMEEYYRKAIEKDPDFALAHMGLGWMEMRAYWGGWSPDPQESLQRALDYGQKALALDKSQGEIHLLLGDVYASMGQLDRGVAEHAKARSLNPNDPDIKAESAAYLAFAGRIDEAIELLTDAMRLNPFFPDWYLWSGAQVYYPARRNDAVIDAVNRMGDPPADPLLFQAASYAQLGRQDEAQQAVKRVLALDPNATVAKFAAQQPYKNPEDLEHYKDGLRKAGLPQGGLTN
jgi:TolB-like protein